MAATDQQVGPDAIFEVVMGFMASKHLFVANEIGLFSALTPLRTTTLSARQFRTGWDTEN
jgi:hypothetical protein